MEVNAQEKYYLSRFRPLTGMVLSSRIYKRSPVQFSPSYGDGTLPVNKFHDYFTFSPPYGDGTRMATPLYPVMEFSPPYGDGTWILLDGFSTPRFSPPYGDGTR